jgi:nitrogen regulatory protein PII
MFMIMLILDNPSLCRDVLDAWEKAGVRGVTILASTGLGRVRMRKGLLDDMPLMPSLEEFFREEESQNRTLLSVVPEKDMVERVRAATTGVVGDLDRPGTGILVVLPVLEAYGLAQ